MTKDFEEILQNNELDLPDPEMCHGFPVVSVEHDFLDTRIPPLLHSMELLVRKYL